MTDKLINADTRSTRLSYLAPAKLNLFLHVTGRLANGYHTLQTVFQLLDWGDDMEFERVETPGIELLNPPAGVPLRDNLIIRAAALLAAPGMGARITLTKRIPMGGGLGGGSSNAATTLIALNALWNLGWSVDELASAGQSLGADVPVFVRGTTAWAEGTGEQLTPLELPERWFVIVRPDCHVSTAEIFGAPQLTRDTPTITMSSFFAGEIRNDLQSVVVANYPKVRNALNFLQNFAPAMMTGSGSCIFAPMSNESEANRVAAEMARRFDTVVAKGINRSPPVVAYEN